jgi:decaprenyl-phosphate phosphoribosyltransferase
MFESLAVRRSAVPNARTGALGLVRTSRPRQWVKNLLVIAAAGAAGALGHDDAPFRSAVAFVGFCLPE